MASSESHIEETKCPCCDNPWAAATGDFFARLCQECEENPVVERDVGLSRSNMDFDGTHARTHAHTHVLACSVLFLICSILSDSSQTFVETIITFCP
eukprot:jgi/Psemu1/300261/fgenesh1_kg.8_\